MNYFKIHPPTIFLFFCLFSSEFYFSQKPKLLIQSGHAANFVGGISPDGKILATGGGDRKVLVWDLKTSRHFSPSFEHQSCVMDLKWDTDNEHFYTGDYTGGFFKWNGKTHQVEKRILEKDTGFWRIQFIPEHNTIAVLCGDSSVRLYDRSLNRKKYFKIKGTYGLSLAYCKSGESEILIVGCRDSTQRIYDAKTLKELNVTAVGNLFLDISFNSNYSRVAYTTPGNVSLLTFPEAKPIREYQVPVNFYNEDGQYHILSTVFSKPGFYQDSLLLISGMENDLILSLCSKNNKTFQDAVYTIPKAAGYVTQFITVPNSTTIISIHQLVKLYTWELKSVWSLPERFISKSEIEMNSTIVGAFNFSPDGSRILVCGNYVHEFSLAEGISYPKTPFGGKSFETVYYLKDGKRIALINGDDYHGYSIYGKSLKKPDTTIYFSTDIITHLVSNRKKQLFIAWNNYTLTSLEEDNMKQIWCDSSLKKNNTTITYLEESADGQLLAVFCDNGEVSFFNTATGKMIQTISTGKEAANSGFFSKDNKYFFVTPFSSNKYQMWSIANGKMQKEFTIETPYEGITIAADPQEKNIICLTFDNQLRILDFKSGTETARFQPDVAGIMAFDFTPDGKQLLTLNSDYVFSLYSYPKFEKLFSFVSVRDKPTDIPFTEDNFYVGGKFLSKLFSVEENGKIYPADQYDLEYNRPDKILEKTAFGDSTLISLYKSAYQKRKKKYAGDFISQNTKEKPEIKILNRLSIDPILFKKELTLQLELKASSGLRELIVKVNKVPVFGHRPLSLGNKKSLDTTLTFRLQHGDNLIEIKTIDKEGKSSGVEILKVKRMKEENYEPDLYVVGIGVSEYNMSGYNLRYAAKDAEDFTDAIGNDKMLFNNKYKLILKNAEVNKSALQRISDFLRSANENDVVIIFMAGHGVLDKNLDYYFAGHDIDFNSPEKKGITIQELEEILAGILPFQKLLIMDSCHSGELFKDDATVVQLNTETEGAVTFRGGGAGIGQNTMNKKTARLMNKMFAELNSCSGTTILTATAGSDFAMESTELKNGLFTYCFLRGLNNMEADLDGDKLIYLDEMISFLRQKVSLLSGGEQEPNTRYENEFTELRLK